MEIWIEHGELICAKRTPDNKEPIDPTPAMMKVFDQIRNRALTFEWRRSKVSMQP